MKTPQSNFLRAFGPGLLFAAVAIGVSHLVQSTRAGALYGPAMILFVIASMAVKYPFYRFGPQYAAATGRSLVHAFRRQGLWIFLLFALLLVITGFIGIAALASGTAVITINAFNLDIGAGEMAFMLLAVNTVILGIGRYHWLDRLTKVFILLLSITTIIAAILTLPIIDFANVFSRFPPELNRATVIFTVALVGWMPAPLEGSVAHSLWTKAKAVDSGYLPRINESLMDFHVGYIGTLFLSLCFMLLGAAVLQEQGDQLARSATQFTGQFIALYESTLGNWSGMLVRIAAVAVMYSTLLAATDSYGRMLGAIYLRLHTEEKPWARDTGGVTGYLYILIVIVLSAGGLGVFILFAESFPIMLAVATSGAFISAPVIAFMVYRSITSDEVSEEFRPTLFMRRYSLFCMIVLLAFAAGYVWLLLTM